MDRGVVGNTEVDFFLARIGNCDAGGTSVSELARGDIIDDDGEIDVFDFDGFSHFFGDAIHDIDIDTGNIWTIIIFEGGEKGVSVDDIIGRGGSVDN